MMLLAGELDAYLSDPASFAPVIAERLDAFRDLYDIDPPFVLTADPPPLAEWPRRSRRQAGRLRASGRRHGADRPRWQPRQLPRPEPDRDRPGPGGPS